jgi:hypothetical protein
MFCTFIYKCLNLKLKNNECIWCSKILVNNKLYLINTTLDCENLKSWDKFLVDLEYIKVDIKILGICYNWR